MDIPMHEIGSFAEVHGLYAQVQNIPRSTLSMRLTRAAGNPEAVGLPRPFKYVANGQVPLYDMREVRRILGIEEGGVNKSAQNKPKLAKKP
jgi:hypothetical protein